jgi:hypothetical protein
MESSKAVSAALSDGRVIKIEVAVIGEQDVASMNFSFSDVAASIETLSQELITVLKRIQPKKATLKFGVEFAVEAGKLTALLAKGSAKANVEISLEWDSDSNKK